MFKPGDKVICINSIDTGLIRGRYYIVDTVHPVLHRISLKGHGSFNYFINRGFILKENKNSKYYNVMTLHNQMFSEIK